MKTANWLFCLMVCGALTCFSTRAATLDVWRPVTLEFPAHATDLK